MKLTKFKNSLTSKILAILILFTVRKSFTKAESDSNSGVIAAATIGSAVAGFGFYQLFSTFCCSNDSLVDQGCKELMNAKIFNEELLLLEKVLGKLSGIDKKQFILSIDEEFANELVDSSLHKIIDCQYYSLLKKTLKNLKFYQTKIPKRIRKLEKNRNKTKYLDVLKDMNELVNRINALIPKLELLNDYITKHKNYYELDSLIENKRTNFRTEIKLLSSKKIYLKEIKSCIFTKYSSSTYPLIDYVSNLDTHISNFTSPIRKASNYPQLVKEANNLKNKLLRLYSLISSDREYLLEKREKENAILQGAFTGFITGTAIGLAASAPKKEIVVIENNVMVPEEEIIIIED